jgi:hypothetical protein
MIARKQRTKFSALPQAGKESSDCGPGRKRALGVDACGNNPLALVLPRIKIMICGPQCQFCVRARAQKPLDPARVGIN